MTNASDHTSFPPAPLSHIRIVLVEPAGALNVGSVARIMKNMGLQQLVLVNPHCDRLGEEARKMAVHAADVLEQAVEVSSLPAALQGCQRAVATTGRDRMTLNVSLEHPRVVLPWIAADPVPSALIFGREDSGLNNEELNYAQRLIHIPSNPVYSSLNLAQAVAICCYELSCCELSNPVAPLTTTLDHALPIAPFSVEQPEAIDLATLDLLESYYQHLEALLLKIGYLYPHTAASRMEKLRRLLHRAYPTSIEVTMLRGMLRQVEWALQQDITD